MPSTSGRRHSRAISTRTVSRREPASARIAGWDRSASIRRRWCIEDARPQLSLTLYWRAIRPDPPNVNVAVRQPENRRRLLAWSATGTAMIEQHMAGGLCSITMYVTCIDFYCPRCPSGRV